MKVTNLTHCPNWLGGQLLLILLLLTTSAPSVFSQVPCDPATQAIPPSLTCPPNQTISLDAGECQATVHFPNATDTDACDPNVIVTQILGPVSGSQFSIGTHLLTFKGVDNVGSVGDCAFEITVIEFQAPQSTMACNDEVQLSLDDAGSLVVNADQILEGGPYGCYNDFLVNVTNFEGFSFGNVLTCNEIGESLTVMVTNPDNGNACWGHLIVEDKKAPVLNCTNRIVNCNVAFENVAKPTVTDNCTANPSLVLMGTSPLDINACDNNQTQFKRIWRATDAQGNVATCNDTITIARPTVVDFPNDIMWHCYQYDSFPGIINAAPLRSNIIDINPATLIINVDPNIRRRDSLFNSGSGVPSNIIGEYCKYHITHTDEILAACGGAPGVFEILRTWVVLDWCTGQLITTGVGGEDNFQAIKVLDTQAPIILGSIDTIYLNANVPGDHPGLCRSMDEFPLPTVIDSCSGVADITVITPIGGLVDGHLPFPGLTVNPVPYWFVIIATDRCGNKVEQPVPVIVTDQTAPTPICIEYTNVSVESSGYAEVLAADFNLASYDNCCLDSMLVRRMDNDPCDDGINDLKFGPAVHFCCEDAGDTVRVVFRVKDCFGNFNECMVQVLVEEKIGPVLVSCPANQRITCDWYANNLDAQLAALQTPAQLSQALDQYFGTPVFFDNCGATLIRNYVSNIDQCYEGPIIRAFNAVDPAGNTAVQLCTQVISVDHVSDWVVEFPADVTINCGTTPPSFGEPEIFYESCELLAVTYEDEPITVVADACYKLLRKWVVINWCVVGTEVDQEVVEQPESQLGLAIPQCDLDNDGDCDARTYRDSWRGAAAVPNPFAPAAYRLRPSANDAHTPSTNAALNFRNPDTDVDTDPWDGYIAHQQTIKVIDNVDPVFVNGCAIPKVCILDNTCEASFTLPTPEVSDCSQSVDVTAEIKIGGAWVDGNGTLANVPQGVYEVVYTAQDNCNNQATCATTVMVKDCKKPTPYCKNGLIVGIMQGNPPMIVIWASDLNDGSFDNCDTDLTFTFSPDTTNTSVTYFCASQNSTSFVDVWVTDDCGNQDFCTTSITIQDNIQGCADPLVSIVGNVSNEEDLGIENVEIQLSGNTSLVTQTNSNGQYLYDVLVPGNDYSVVPTLDTNPLNGVTTFDLVLISKHILGVTPLGSPYKIIAADANKSGSVTTFDLVEIRKLILYINDDFTSNTSWRFVDKNFVFPNPANPWQTQFPELANFNDIALGLHALDFVGIKIGDVNCSAATNFTPENEDRSQLPDFELRTVDKDLTEGQLVSVPFTTDGASLSGFQFTLDFDANQLEFVELAEGVLSAENFGFAKLGEGAITVSWNNADGSAKWLQGDVFNLVFKAKSVGNISDLVGINSRFTKAEAYSPEGLQGVSLVPEQPKVNGYALHQNMPNPFTGATSISFELPKAADCTFTFTDVSGKILKVLNGHFAEGKHKINVKRSELDASGVIYYSFKTSEFTETRRMLLVD